MAENIFRNKNNNFKDENYKEFWELNSEIEKLHNSIEEKNELYINFLIFLKIRK